jgi:uncharacterized linocin/CFP29 family protein
MKEAMIEAVFKGQAYGGVAARLLANGMNVNALRTNATTLRKDEWKQYDEAVLKAALRRLQGVADLERLGLVFDLQGKGMSKTILEWETASDMGDASMNMDAVNRGDTDRPEYVLNGLPLPIIFKDFDINLRVLEASRNGGSPLDTTNAEAAAEKVAEKAENMLFNGASSYSFGGRTIYGYTDYPDRNTYTLGTDWASDTGQNILTDVRGMKAAAIADRHHGPYILYIPTAYETKMDDDYYIATDTHQTIRQRILSIANIMDVKVSDYLTTGNVLLVEMAPTTVRLVKGLGITNLQWEESGGLKLLYKVMTIMVPQIRSNQDGKCGIVHAS